MQRERERERERDDTKQSKSVTTVYTKVSKTKATICEVTVDVEDCTDGARMARTLNTVFLVATALLMMKSV